MPATIPFTAYIQLYPSKTGNRWEKMRELEKFGAFINQALSGDAAVNLAKPGGGQSRDYGRFGWEYEGVSVKPAFGCTPAQATLVGFYDPGAINAINAPAIADAEAVQQTYPDTTVFCCNRTMTGPLGATPWSNGPNTALNDQVKALKANIEQNLTLNLPSTVAYKVIKMDLRGVIFGVGGLHFPQ